MDFTHEDIRIETVRLMKDIASSHQDDFDAALEEHLTPAEVIVQRYVQELGFREGAWYRPAHNIIVPAAMIAIAKEQGMPRDLVYVAQLHDAGNSQMKIAATTEGANWENTDKRWKHMELGAEMLEEELEAHVKSLEIKPERLRKLSLIVRTHDLPYIRVGSQADTQLPTVTVEELFSLAEVHTYGGDNPVGYRLIDPETRAMRGADRTFVPSALSWYKDMVSHFSDVGYLAKAKGLGFELSPEQFLRSRMAFFWDNAEAVPTRWDLDTFNLDTSRAAYNEGGRCEAPYTSTDAAIISNMMGRRAAELDAVNAATTPDQFAQVFERAFVSEMKYVIERAT